MKKIIWFFGYLLIIAACQGQQCGEDAYRNAEYYMKKSRDQKSGGWVCLGIGSAFILAGNLVGNNKNSTFDDAASGAGMGAIGVLTALYSIRLFIASANNKRKALYGVGLKMQPVKGLPPSVSKYEAYPAVQLHLRLGK